MKPLNNENIKFLSDEIIIPKYAREKTNLGIVHFGPGAFHRAHQAYYFDKLLETNPNYAICEVSLHSSNIRDALIKQDFLYTIAQIDAEPKMQIIGAIKEILVAPENPQKVIETLASDNLKIVTSTITEKGYYLDIYGKLDLNAPEIAHDLKNPNSPKSYFGFVMAGLEARKAKNLPPFTIIVCDNLSNNGRLIKAALIEFAKIAYPNMLDYLANLQCPSTMVDSITPATDDILRQKTSNRLGLIDNWPIARESFTQWVIEDFENSNLIDWQSLGIEITKDVKQYENAKLRILNGAHSSLAYFGLLMGYKNVFEATQNIEIMSHIKLMIFDEIIPLLNADFDLIKYTNSVLLRFENPNIDHQLSQIAWDGSKKLPVRLLQSIEEAIKQNKPYEKMVFSFACWILFIEKMAKANIKIIDPIGNKLEEIGKELSGQIDDIDLFLGEVPILSEKLSSNNNFKNTLKAAYKKAISYKGKNNEN